MHRLIVVVLLLGFGGSAVAQEKKIDAEARAKVVAPCIDDQTLAIARIDLARFDMDTIVAQVLALGKIEAADVAAARQHLSDWLAGLKMGGAKELYVVVSLADLPGQMPFLVIPLTEGSDGKKLAGLLRGDSFEGFHLEKIGPVMVGGS